MSIDRGEQTDSVQSGPELVTTSTGKADSDEQLIRWYIEERRAERKRKKQLVMACAIGVIGAFLVAGLAEVVRLYAGRQTSGRPADQAVRLPSASIAPGPTPVANPCARQEPVLAATTTATESKPAANPAVPPGLVPAAAPPEPTVSSPASTEGAPPAAIAARKERKHSGVVVDLSAGAPPAIAAGQERKHSGVIVGVSADTHTITIEELGASSGPGSTPQRRTVRLTSQTRIALVSRSEDAPAIQGWPGEFKESPVGATDLHPGDFATVTATGSGDELVAESMTVVQTAGDIQSPPKGRAGATSPVR